MAHKDKHKRTLLIIAAAAVVVIAAIITIVLLQASKDDNDPYRQTETTNIQEEDTSGAKSPEAPVEDPAPVEEEPEETVSLDPDTVATVDIEPMSITVSYVKGVGGFEYQVLRSPRGTQYVEFRSPDLIGTKCTDDEGTFASIIESPDTAEASTLSKTQTVDGTEYGLALSADTCTSESELLDSYQTSFSDAFGLLSKTE